MVSATRGAFIGNITWFASVVGGSNVILCHTSALECLELFVGYLNEKRIDVYAKEPGIYENINYHIVNSFDGFNIVSIRNVRCTSVNQTINDMLADFANVDEQSLVEALGTYYYLHGDSFNGLKIEPQHQEIFDSIRDWAIEYYNEG